MAVILLILTIALPIILAIIFWDKVMGLSKKKPYLFGFIISTFISIVAIEIYSMNLLQRFQYLVNDHLITIPFTDPNQNAKKQSKKDKKYRPKNSSLIIYGLISSKALQAANDEKGYNMGWPWRRKTYGQISDFLNQCGIKLIIFDITFSEKSVYRASERPDKKGFYKEEDDDLLLANSTQRIGKSIIAFIFNKGKSPNDIQKKYSKASDKKLKQIAKKIKYPLKEKGFDRKKIIDEIVKIKLNYNKSLEPYSLKVELKNPSISFPEYNQPEAPYKTYLGTVPFIAFSNAIIDEDGIIRRTHLLIRYNNRYYPSLSFGSYLAYIGFDRKSETLVVDGNTLIVRNKKITLDSTGKLRIKYYGWANALNSNYDDIYSLTHILLFKDKVSALFKQYKKLYPKANPVDLKKETDLYQNYPKYQKTVKAVQEQLKRNQQKDDTSKYKLNSLEKQVINSDLKGKIIIFASNAAGLYDLRPTPFLAKEIGGHIHVSAIDNLIQGDWLIELPGGYNILFILTIALLTGFLTSGASILRGILTWLGLTFFVYGLGVYLFKYHNIVMEIVIPALSIFFIYLIDSIIDYFNERKEKGYIKGAFGQYLSPKIIDIIMHDPSKLALGGQRKTITAFFSDIAGFSTISEQLTPEALVHLLNDYLTDMCQIVSKYDGTVDKFEGDAIIAFWGAPLDDPLHAKLACWTSIEMQECLLELRKKWAAENYHSLIQNMKMRIGLNSGFAVVGNMGSAQRMDYTMMGDTVNLAARLEGANKFYGTYNMISDATYQSAKDFIEVRELDKLQVVGKKEAVVVHELLDKKGNVKGVKADSIELYIKALDLYKQQKFDEAIKGFESVLKIIPDPPSSTYIDRCKLLKKNPPGKDWDGRFVLTSKG